LVAAIDNATAHHCKALERAVSAKDKKKQHLYEDILEALKAARGELKEASKPPRHPAKK